MVNSLLIFAFLATCSSVLCRRSDDDSIDRLRGFIKNGFSLDDLIGDNANQLQSEMARRLSGLVKERKRVDLQHAVDPEVDLDADGIVKRWGYPSEKHDVQTEDGYILTVFRIPHGRGENQTKSGTPRPAVFLQHGLLCSSTNWITNLPNQSLAFVLADAGFDVWMGNMRGNTYARRHVKLSPSSDAFWRFSWDEMAKYDLPAMIELVVNVTKQPKVFYVGHSQGTMIMFAQLSRSSAFAARIRHFFAMGPVATLGHLQSKPIKIMSAFQNLIEDFVWLFGVKEFLPNDMIFDWLARGLCSWDSRIFCSDFLFVISGYDPSQLNSTRLPVYISHTPAGTSVQNMIHFAQMVKSNKFQMYDYGSPAENNRHYKQPTPPLYDISAVNVSTSVYWGGKDLLADPTDVEESILGKMHSVKDYVFVEQFDHLDFIWAMNANLLVYQHVLKKMTVMSAIG